MSTKPSIDPEKLAKIGSKLLRLNNILHKEIPSFKSGKIDKFLRLEHGLCVFFRLLGQIRKKRLLEGMVSIKVHGDKRKALRRVLNNMMNFCKTANELRKHRYLLNWRMGSNRKIAKNVNLARIFGKLVVRKKMEVIEDIKDYCLKMSRRRQEENRLDNWIQGLVKLDYTVNKSQILNGIRFLNLLREIKKSGVTREKAMARVLSKLRRRRLAYALRRLRKNERKCQGIGDLLEILRFLSMRTVAFGFFKLMMNGGEEELREKIEKMVKNIEKIGKAEGFQGLKAHVLNGDANQQKLLKIIRILEEFMRKRAFLKLVNNERRLRASEKVAEAIKEKLKEDFEKIRENLAFLKEKKLENQENAEKLMKILEKLMKKRVLIALYKNKRQLFAAEKLKESLEEKIRQDFEDFIGKIEKIHEKKLENQENANKLIEILDKMDEKRAFNAIIRRKNRVIAAENINNAFQEKIREKFHDFLRKIQEKIAKKQENQEKIADFMRFMEKIMKKRAFKALINRKKRLESAKNIKKTIENKLIEDFNDFMKKVDFSNEKKQEIRSKILNLFDFLSKSLKKQGFLSILARKNRILASESLKTTLNSIIRDYFQSIRGFKPKNPINKLDVFKFAQFFKKKSFLQEAFNKIRDYSAVSIEKKADFMRKTLEFNERFQGLQCERLFSAFQMILAYSNHIKDGQDLYKTARKALLASNMRKFKQNINRKIDFKRKTLEFNERLLGFQSERLFSAFQVILAYSNHIKDGQNLYKTARKALLASTIRKFKKNSEFIKKDQNQRKNIEFIERLQGFQSERLFSAFQVILAYSNHIKDGQNLYKTAKKALLASNMRKFANYVKLMKKTKLFIQKINGTMSFKRNLLLNSAFFQLKTLAQPINRDKIQLFLHILSHFLTKNIRKSRENGFQSIKNRANRVLAIEKIGLFLEKSLVLRKTRRFFNILKKDASANKIAKNLNLALEGAKKEGFEGLLRKKDDFNRKINILAENLRKLRNFIDFRAKLQALYRIKSFSDAKKLLLQEKLTKLFSVISLKIQLKKSDFLYSLRKPSEKSRLFDLLLNFLNKTSRINSIIAFQRLKKPFLSQKGLKKLYNTFRKLKSRNFLDFIRKIPLKPAKTTENTTRTPIKPVRCLKTDDLPKKDHYLAVSPLEAFKDSLAMSPISLDRTLEKIGKNTKSALFVKPLSKMQFSDKFRSQDPSSILEAADPQQRDRRYEQRGPQTAVSKDFERTNDESANLNRIDDLLSKSRAKLRGIYATVLRDDKENIGNESFISDHDDDFLSHDAPVLNPDGQVLNDDAGTLNEISQVLEKHVADRGSKDKLLEVLCLKKQEEGLRECEICGRELELLKELETLCAKDIELKVLVYRKFLKVPLRTVITRPVGAVVRRVVVERRENRDLMRNFAGLSPIFNKPYYY